MNRPDYAIPSNQKNKKSLFPRILAYFGIVLLLLIPTYIAVATFMMQKNAPIITTHAVYDTLTLTGPDEKRVNASDTVNNSLFAMFATLTGSGVEVVSIPDSHLAGHYVATMKNPDVNDRYDFYFQRGSAICYYTTPQNKIFRVEHAQTTAFLNSSFAFELYEASAIPVLTTAATDEVIPTMITWHYRTENGLFTERLQKDLAIQTHTYPIANDIAFYFSTQPSTHEVTIRRADELLYRGSFDGISLPLLEDEVLDFEIVAVFDQNSRLDYYGQLTYGFRMQVVEAARFTLNTTTPKVGDFLVLRCENVKNAGKLQFHSEPALPASPIVFPRGDYVYAAIPVHTAGAHALRVTYGTVAASFTLDVQPRTGTAHTVTEDALQGDWAQLLTKTIPDLILQKGATADSGLTPKGGFAMPGGKRIFGFADTLLFPEAQSATAPLPFGLYRVDGEVGALSAGRVLEVGESDALGKYVILDHGCGIYTYYAGLCETRVQVGNVVAVGDTLGLSSTHFYHENAVLIMASVGKAAVSVDFLYSDPAPAT